MVRLLSCGPEGNGSVVREWSRVSITRNLDSRARNSGPHRRLIVMSGSTSVARGRPEPGQVLEPKPAK